MTGLLVGEAAETLSPRAIALARKKACENGCSLAAQVVEAMQKALEVYKQQSDASSVKILMQVLTLHHSISRLDPTLSQELAQQGSHLLLLKLLSLERHNDEHEGNDDDYLELMQDQACEIAALYEGNFPVNGAIPFTVDEVRQRLPIEFSLQSASCESILLHQVVTSRQTAQADVGYLLWPSAVYLSRWLERNASILFHSASARTILELGSGCGLCGIVAASIVRKQPAVKTLLSDFNRTVLMNLQRNVNLNDLQTSCSVVGLDFCQQLGSANGCWVDLEGRSHASVDLVIAADIICQPSDALAVAKTLSDTLRPGGCAYLVSANAKHRFGVQCFPEACRTMNLDVKVENIDLEKEICIEYGLKDDLEKSCGYIEGMSLQMFFIRTPKHVPIHSA